MSPEEIKASLEAFRKLSGEDITVKLLRDKLLSIYNNCNPSTPKKEVDQVVEDWAINVEGGGQITSAIQTVVGLMAGFANAVAVEKEKNKPKKEKPSKTASSGATGSTREIRAVNKKFERREDQLRNIESLRVNSIAH